MRAQSGVQRNYAGPMDLKDDLSLLAVRLPDQRTISRLVQAVHRARAGDAEPHALEEALLHDGAAELWGRYEKAGAQLGDTHSDLARVTVPPVQGQASRVHSLPQVLAQWNQATALGSPMTSR